MGWGLVGYEMSYRHGKSMMLRKRKKGAKGIQMTMALVSIRHERIYNDSLEERVQRKEKLRFPGKVPRMNALENLVDVRSLSLHEVFLKSIHYFVGRDLLRYYLLKIDNACITLNTRSEVATTQGSLGHRCHPWVFQAGLWWYYF